MQLLHLAQEAFLLLVVMPNKVGKSGTNSMPRHMADFLRQPPK